MRRLQTSAVYHHRFQFCALLLAVAAVVTALHSTPVSAGSVPAESTIALQTADALPLPGSFQVVNNEPGDQTNPHVECNLVTYTNDDIMGRSIIHYYDLATSTDNEIPGDDVDLLSVVSGSHIAYTEVDYPGDHIMIFDTVSQTRTVVPGWGRANPSIGGNLVAFEDRSSQPAGQWGIATIGLYDLSSGTVSQLTDNSAHNSFPSVSPNGDAVVWQKCDYDGFNCDVYAAVQTSPGVFATRQLTGAGGQERFARTNGDLAVYVSDRNGDNDIYYQPVTGGAEVRLAIAGDQRWPTISENLISFQSQGQNGYDYDIFVYDIISRKLYRVTSTPQVAETLGEIDVCDGVGRLVYLGVSNGSFDTLNFTFQVPGSTRDEINDLISLVRSFNLPHGTENSLVTKLESALAAIGTSDPATACSSLSAFINQCQAQSGKKLTGQQAAQLITAATQIKTALCPGAANAAALHTSFVDCKKSVPINLARCS
ncbi:MAG TPA: hypothetical protein VE961_00195 [Pyrinomonadaceae bacterium]|nr:hypothetical protein [Pyrinomonadaceae bacterium]